MHWTDLATFARLQPVPPNAVVPDTRMARDPHDPRLEALVLDLVEWVASEPRSYAEVMDAWRTSCPKLAVWEEAVDRGLLAREAVPAGGVVVTVTASGRSLLEANRSMPAGSLAAGGQPLHGR